MAEFITLDGELHWIRTNEPEEFKGKSAWKATIRPNKESMDKIIDLQAKGVKNQLKKDDDGYYINFSRPTEKKKKNGQVFKTFTAPVVTDRSGATITDMVANGAKGTMKLELSSFKGAYGTVTTAMLDSLILDEWKKYETDSQAEAY